MLLSNPSRCKAYVPTQPTQCIHKAHHLLSHSLALCVPLRCVTNRKSYRQPPSQPSSLQLLLHNHPASPPDDTKNTMGEHNLPGGRLCFNFSAFSASLSTNVYRSLRHRTLNLICDVFLLRLILAAGCITQVSQISPQVCGRS